MESTPDTSVAPLAPVLDGAPRIPGVVDLEPIGRGGFGVVYRGRQPDMGREVAVKVISATARPGSAEERWRREVTAMGRLSNHPNIVAVFSGGITADGSPYLVMPYVPGGSLGERIAEDGPMNPMEAACVGAKLAGALATAHAAGVLHRDVKPDNVLLSPYGEPQITDFGIARMLDATTTATGTVHATLTYAPPEVLAGQPATEGADVYGLGATLYACLTGAPPFPKRDDETLVALVGRIASQPPPDLRAAGIPRPLASVIEQSLAKTPGDRIQSAEEMRRLLEAAAEAMDAYDDSPTTEMPALAGPPRGGSVADSHTAVIPVMPEAAAPRRYTASSPSRHLPTTALDSHTAVPAPVVPGVEREPDQNRRSPDRDRQSLGAILAVGLLVVALLGFGLLRLTRDEDGGDRTASAATTDAVVQTTDAPNTTEASATTEATATTEVADTTEPEQSTTTSTSASTTAPASTPGPATGGSIADVATTYADRLASGDIGGAYSMTSPGFQAVQPFDRYQSFWDNYVIAVVGSPSVDEDARTATVTFTFDGSTERIQLSLVEGGGGGWLVDGPRPRR